MAKISFVVMGGHGHVNPTLALAEELARRGHAVDYWVTDEFRAAVEATGSRFRLLDSLLAKGERPKNMDKETMLRMMPKKFVGETLHVLPQIDRALAEDRPDLILYDNMIFGARVVADSLGIPSVALFTSYAGNGTFNLMKGLGPLPDDAQAEFDEAIGQIATKYGVKPVDFTELFSNPAGLNLVFMPKAWQFEGGSFDERYVFVGPCLGTRTAAADFPIEVLSRKPLLFISLGTAFNDHPEFYKMTFDAFRDSAWNVVMSVGQKVDWSTLGEIPANFTVRKHVPQLAVLQQTDVFLTHGGMNSTMEGLMNGVPLVSLPQMFEQAMTSRRIEELGVGISLAEKELSAELLRKSVDSVHESAEVKAKIEPLRDAIIMAGGPRLAGDVVETHLAKFASRETAPTEAAL